MREVVSCGQVRTHLLPASSISKRSNPFYQLLQRYLLNHPGLTWPACGMDCSAESGMPGSAGTTRVTVCTTTTAPTARHNRSKTQAGLQRDRHKTAGHFCETGARKGPPASCDAASHWCCRLMPNPYLCLNSDDTNRDAAQACTACDDCARPPSLRFGPTVLVKHARLPALSSLGVTTCSTSSSSTHQQ
jgi:hypothetical protein